ncbi:MAG: uroporphyrinogen-III synthase [Natronospirillum sp.]
MVIITKPADQAEHWLKILSTNGWTVLSVPLLGLEDIPYNADQRALWLNLDQYAGVIMVSPQAALSCAKALDEYWPQPPAGVHWLCNGAGTAQTLRAHYPMADALSLHFPAAGNQAEDVLALHQMQHVAQQKWLIVAGEGGRTVMADTLITRGANVTRLEVYRRHSLRLNQAQVQSLSIPDAIIQISSRQALESLTSQAPLVTKQEVKLLVSSSRLAAAAEQHAWQHIMQANGASLEATLNALKRHANHPVIDRTKSS